MAWQEGWRRSSAAQAGAGGKRANNPHLTASPQDAGLLQPSLLWVAQHARRAPAPVTTIPRSGPFRDLRW